jgi:hypothetical protein
MFQYALINELLPRYTTFVLSQNPDSVERTIELAKLSETCCLPADHLTNLVMDSVQAQTKLAESDASAIKELTAKLNQLAANSVTRTALLIFSGCYGNRDHRPGSSVHRESAQMADDDDVTNCLYSPLFKYPFRGHTVTCRITLPMNSNTDNTLSAAGCVMN